MPRRRCFGFTLIELLVVIAIIGVLAALVLPAVQSARENGRRAQCLNHLHQIGIALHSYHSTHSIFPPAILWREPSLTAWGTPNDNPFDNNPQRVGPSWLVSILPYLEQEHLYERVNVSFGMPQPENATVRRFTMQVYLCPTDSFNENIMVRYGGGWTRSNYAVPGGVGAAVGQQIVGINQYWGDRSLNFRVRRGVMGIQGAARLDEIIDGRNLTALAWEIRTHTAADPRGVWALSKIGSVLIGNCWNDTCQGINNTTQNGGDVVLHCFSDPHQGMSCLDNADFQAGPRSMHDGGCHMMTADGAARFVTNSMDLSIGRAIDTIAGTEIVKPDF